MKQTLETISERVEHLEKENLEVKEKLGKSENEIKAANFEEAMEISGFGLYNIIVLTGALFTLVGAMFETSAISYVLPSAECDLKLTLLDKGILNAITYAGMISAAFPCGYISDAYGRRKILFISCLLHGVCVLGYSLCQNVIQLIILKLFGGVFMTGPSAAVMSYVMEMHGKRHRERVLMVVGSMLSTGNLVLPLMALAILTNKWYYEFWGLEFNHWKAFLALSSLPSFIAGAFFILLPESPKFLLSQNQPEKALEVLKSIYALNHHKSRKNYPVEHLKLDNDDEKTNSTASIGTIENIPPKSDSQEKEEPVVKVSKFRQSLVALKPMFHKPYLRLGIQIYALNFCILLGKNTLRLWLPQLFASTDEYNQVSQEPADICTILEYSVNKTETVINYETEKCEVFFTADTYTNNIIVALSSFIGYFIAGSIIDKVGPIRITTISLLLSSILGMALYWSTSSLTTLIISSAFTTVSGLSGTSLIGTSVALFPTSLRTMVVALQMMFGRVGSLAGNILFPTFIAMGCIPPFILISGMMLLGSIMSGFMPTNRKDATN